MNLIIVEDERIIREGITELVQGLSYVEVLAVCADAHEAFEQIQIHSPDAVITDIIMHGATGIDMIGWCREAGIGCEFVLISGYSEFKYALTALKLGSFDYVTKPLNIPSFLLTMHRLQKHIE